MKFTYLVPVLALSAALGASSPAPFAASPPAFAAPAIPPWLSDAWQGEVSSDDPAAVSSHPVAPGASGACTYEPGSDEEAGGCESCGASAEAAAHAAHAGSHAAAHPAAHAQPTSAGDPHAQVYEGEDPHAGLYADPHAQLHGSDVDPHAGLADDASARSVPIQAVERSRAPNGKTVAEVFAARRTLDQSTVTVRGTVVKLTEGVLGKTYLHLRDGTGSPSAADDDLTVTTTETFALGETVELEGRLAIDQDLGVGYSYPALLADAARVQP